MRALNYIRTFKKKSYCILFHPVARPICRPLSKLTGAKATSYLLLQLFCSVKLSLPSSPSPLILHHHPSIPPAFHFSLAGRLRLIAHRPGNSFFSPRGETIGSFLSITSCLTCFLLHSSLPTSAAFSFFVRLHACRLAAGLKCRNVYILLFCSLLSTFSLLLSFPAFSILPSPFSLL